MVSQIGVQQAPGVRVHRRILVGFDQMLPASFGAVDGVLAAVLDPGRQAGAVTERRPEELRTAAFQGVPLPQVVALRADGGDSVKGERLGACLLYTSPSP